MLVENGFAVYPTESDLDIRDPDADRHAVFRIPDHLLRMREMQVARTDNGRRNAWFVNPKIAQTPERPGVLEIEADRVGAKPGALEPSFALGPAPRNSMHQYTDDELKIIARIKSRLTYLKNPRFTTPSDLRYRAPPQSEPEAGIPISASSDSFASSEISPSDPHSGIIALPSSVLFTNYSPNKSYSNTTNSHRFRLSIPAPYEYSPYFTAALVSSPIHNDGLVAPGMSCQYKITFTPDSLANFHQMYLVASELGECFQVPVLAKREPPSLTLPETLHCGPCRAGYVAVRRWEFENVGGPGRFVVVRQDEEPDPFRLFGAGETAWDAGRGSARHGMFEISPAAFTLDAGEVGEIVVRFAPDALEEAEVTERTDEVLIQIACDNCQVLELLVAGIAQRPVIKITRVTHADDVEVDIASSSGGFDLVIPFGVQNPKASTTCSVTVTNESLLRLPFEWTVYGNRGVTKNHLNLDIGPSQHSAFEISPSCGWLHPAMSSTFEIVFSPDASRQYDAVASLLLLEDQERVPSAGPEMYTDDGCEHTVLRIQCTGCGIPYNLSVRPTRLSVPGTLHVGSSYSTRLRFTNGSVSSVRYEWFLDGINERALEISMSSQIATIAPHSCMFLELRLTGRFPGSVAGALVCKSNGAPVLHIPVRAMVKLSPGALRFATDVVDFGLIALGDAKRIGVPLVNLSEARLKWRVQGFVRAADGGEEGISFVMCEPAEGVISPAETILIGVTFVPTWYQRFRGILELDIIDDGPGFDETQKTKEIGGVPLMVSAVAMRAEVMTPKAVLVHPRSGTTTPVCYLNIPCQQTITVRNLTMLPTAFRWVPSDDVAQEFDVECVPAEGMLQGGAEIEVEFTFTCWKLGTLDIPVEFFIDGMVEAHGCIATTFNLTVQRMEVSFEIEDERAPPARKATTPDLGVEKTVPWKDTTTSKTPTRPQKLFLDFGTDCPIFENRSLTLVIKNLSAIASPYRVRIERYEAPTLNSGGAAPYGRGDHAAHASVPMLKKGGSRAFVALGASKKQEDNARQRAGRGPTLLQPTKADRIGFNSQAGREYIANIWEVRRMIQRMHQLLKEGRGAAFHPSPNEGMIAGWGEVRIAITSYNNLVGLYQDTLVCEIGEWVRQEIPVRLGVVGLPVKLTGAQLVAKRWSPDAVDRVNFGTRIVNKRWTGADGVRIASAGRSRPDTPQLSGASPPDTFTKVVQIENQSPRDILLNWHRYIRCTPIVSDARRPVTSAVNTGEIVQPGNVVEEGVFGVFSVSPWSLIVPAFKSASFRISFTAHMVGSFDGVVAAEAGYIQSDGSVVYLPQRPTSRGGYPIVLKPSSRPMSSKHVAGKSISGASIGPNDSGMVRLHMQGRCIEPKLTLDVGDTIHIKESTHHRREGGGAGVGGGGGSPRTVNVFLKNNTGAVCSFSMDATPPSRFKVFCADMGGKYPLGSSRTQTRESGLSALQGKPHLHVYELKPTDTLLIAVEYTPPPPPPPVVDDEGDKRRMSRASVRSERLRRRPSTPGRALSHVEIVGPTADDPGPSMGIDAASGRPSLGGDGGASRRPSVVGESAASRRPSLIGDHSASRRPSFVGEREFDPHSRRPSFVAERNSVVGAGAESRRTSVAFRDEVGSTSADMGARNPSRESFLRTNSGKGTKGGERTLMDLQQQGEKLGVADPLARSNQDVAATEGPTRSRASSVTFRLGPKETKEEVLQASEPVATTDPVQTLVQQRVVNRSLDGLLRLLFEEGSVQEVPIVVDRQPLLSDGE
ncbi:hypothetical protein BDK51DRAFT_46800 [Blyttiomyces helicus]|uniref:MSP domain-containing protein n=1 Tax=Blyttiomyces helicus TaxID=388810 RepID=A0A4P9WDS7_9FUNG|nr:hypothetical protein BDK51DRAFT_46800 [Blyttiomyces helicus]|eukprot:RKO89895.1 hypothetical protein BDK51DRAFT_46800 [Blyttiomyces helicus]